MKPLKALPKGEKWQKDTVSFCQYPRKDSSLKRDLHPDPDQTIRYDKEGAPTRHIGGVEHATSHTPCRRRCPRGSKRITVGWYIGVVANAVRPRDAGLSGGIGRVGDCAHLSFRLKGKGCVACEGKWRGDAGKCVVNHDQAPSVVHQFMRNRPPINKQKIALILPKLPACRTVV